MSDPVVVTHAGRAGASESYRELRPAKIVETVIQLQNRIAERFPDSNLVSVVRELVAIAREAVVRAEQIRQPILWLRLLVCLLIGGLIPLLIMLVRNLRLQNEIWELEHFAQSFESSIGSIVFVSAAVLFLASLERRWKRERALAAIRELRAMAHIVDMHQLTKDPEVITRASPTPSSPKRTLTTSQLGRYLDYCSELLSLIGKIGAIYVQQFPDVEAFEAADQLASLTNDLSRNIWQKIMILDRVVESSPKL